MPGPALPEQRRAAQQSWAALRLHLPAWPGLPLAALSILASTAVQISFQLAIGTVAFWAPRGAEELSPRAYTLAEAHNFPLDGTRGIVRGLLMTVVPIGLTAWFPARVLVGLDRRPWA